jgi:hypothetical protein
VPQPAVVEVGGKGAPIGLRIADCGLRIGKGRTLLKIEAVRETWRIDDQWWREPINRMYYEVLLEQGARAVLFQDLMTKDWYIQAP